MALGAELIDMGYRSVRVYTLAMRFPRMVGKGFNGERLPGGPYTVPQFVGGGMTFGLSGISAYFLPIINPLVNLLIGAGLTIVIGGALANIPLDGIKITTRLGWMLGLLVSTAPSTSELMPAASPVAVVGGDVIVVDFPRRHTPPTRRRPAQPRGVEPVSAPPPTPSERGSASAPSPVPPRPAAAAAVFGALTGATGADSMAS
ncbi:hypothetical protein [Mycobacterium hubeiense]|uniref:hypothetical protein n=1 Tax=Mycobacterium hubeiense TaxID=1867256 RepID=UPI000C7F3459|nr:hypothetical protein [Mycobacterium sp. QGD 101]